jgi:hypothetical protein
MRWYVFCLKVLLGAPGFGVEFSSGPEALGHKILFPADATVLEASGQRKDIGCQVQPDKPFLGMDLKFHSGYQASVPLRGLEGRGNLLTVLLRVIPKGQNPVHFFQKVPVPEIGEKASGTVDLQGEFELGQGAYHVDWLIRDIQGRYCSAHWEIRASLSGKEKAVTVALPPASVQPPDRGQFVPEPPVERIPTESPVNVKLLINFAPSNPGAAALDPLDVAGLVSILRNIARSPDIKNFSVVAFNLGERRTLYRQSSSDEIDFPALGEALKNLGLGTVSASHLASKNGDAAFIAKLLVNEAESKSPPDALIFVGLKSQLNSRVPEEEMKSVAELGSPVFYLNYASDPQAAPGRDTIGRVVQFFKGREYTISGPRDLCNAVSEMMSRISQFKQTRTSAGSPEVSGFFGDKSVSQTRAAAKDSEKLPDKAAKQQRHLGGQVAAEPDMRPSSGWREAGGAALHDFTDATRQEEH